MVPERAKSGVNAVVYWTEMLPRYCKGDPMCPFYA